MALKPICKTRWSSRIDAVNPLRYQLEQIIEALESFLNTQESIETVTTANNKSGADLFLDEILNFKFICSLIIRHDILSNINITSKALQQEDLNIEKAKLLIDSSLKYIQDYRCDEKFKNILKEAEHIAIKLNIEKFFVKTRKRTRTQNIIFPYENQDTEIQNEDYYFKITFFLNILDKAITALKERFELLTQHIKNFEIILNLNKCKDMNNVIRVADGNDLIFKFQYHAITATLFMVVQVSS